MYFPSASCNPHCVTHLYCSDRGNVQCTSGRNRARTWQKASDNFFLKKNALRDTQQEEKRKWFSSSCPTEESSFTVSIMLTLRCCKALHTAKNLVDNDTGYISVPSASKGIPTNRYASQHASEETLLSLFVSSHSSKRWVLMVFSHSISTASSIILGLAVNYWNSLFLIGRREGLNLKSQSPKEDAIGWPIMIYRDPIEKFCQT